MLLGTVPRGSSVLWLFDVITAQTFGPSTLGCASARQCIDRVQSRSATAAAMLTMSRSGIGTRRADVRQDHAPLPKPENAVQSAQVQSAERRDCQRCAALASWYTVRQLGAASTSAEGWSVLGTLGYSTVLMVRADGCGLRTNAQGFLAQAPRGGRSAAPSSRWTRARRRSPSSSSLAERHSTAHSACSTGNAVAWMVSTRQVTSVRVLRRRACEYSPGSVRLWLQGVPGATCS